MPIKKIFKANINFQNKNEIKTIDLELKKLFKKLEPLTYPYKRKDGTIMTVPIFRNIFLKNFQIYIFIEKAFFHLFLYEI